MHIGGPNFKSAYDNIATDRLFMKDDRVAIMTWSQCTATKDDLMWSGQESRLSSGLRKGQSGRQSTAASHGASASGAPTLGQAQRIGSSSQERSGCHIVKTMLEEESRGCISDKSTARGPDSERVRRCHLRSESQSPPRGNGPDTLSKLSTLTH